MSLLLGLVRFLCIILAVGEIKCLENTCEKGCIQNVMLSKSNLSRDSDQNITVPRSVFDSVIEYDAWNHIISDENKTSEDLPHDVVPLISNYERGKARQNRIC